MTQPEPPDPDWPRYSDKPFPPYRFVPGRTPHPRRDPQGHQFGRPEIKPRPAPPERWRECGTYLLGVDLYNYAYWWECHEELESLWHVVGHDTPQGQFLQGIIQVSAANLQRFLGKNDAAQWLADRGLGRHQGLPETYMGLHLPTFAEAVRAWFSDRSPKPALITLG